MSGLESFGTINQNNVAGTTSQQQNDEQKVLQQPQQQYAGQQMQQPVTNQQQANPTQPMVMNIVDAIRQVSSVASLSVAGEKYVDDIKKCINDIKHPGEKFEFNMLNFPVSCLGVSMNGNSILLIFEESVITDTASSEPVIGYADAVAVSYHATNQSVIRDNIVVTKQDYTKHAVMAAYIVNVLRSYNSAIIDSINIDSFRDHYLEININPQGYDNFLARYNPHGVPARADLKFVISLIPHQHRQQQQNGLFGVIGRRTERVELAAVGVYTDFISAHCSTPTGVPMFIPQVHISEITTSVMHERILPVILAMTIGQVLDQKLWKYQFHDLGTKKPNIGNLWTDKDGKPVFADAMDKVEFYLENYCTKPAILLDITSGRANTVGLLYYLDQAFNRYAVDAINSFFISKIGRTDTHNFIPVDSNVTAVGSNSTMNFSGYYIHGNTFSDSRWCDYLFSYVDNSQNPNISKLLENWYESREHMNIQKNIFGATSFTSLYMNYIIALNHVVFNPIKAFIDNSIKSVYQNAGTGAMPVTHLMANANGFAVPTVQPAFVPQRPNEMAQLYAPLFK